MIRTYRFDAAALFPSRAEALAYLRVRGTPDAATDALLTDCFAELSEISDCRCRAGVLPITIADSIHPSLRQTRLQGCQHFLLFCATVGTSLDRRIARYAHTAPARAAVLDAAGGALVEALCDKLTETLAAELAPSTIGNRFSPGYGKLPLEAQRQIHKILELSRIGVGLNDSLLFSPSKTVTALMPIHS